MTEYPVRHFLSDEAVAHVGEGLLARTLPREEWTHEAHLAATTYLVDIKRQFEDKSDHLGMVGEVLETLIHQQHEEFMPGPEDAADPRL